MVRRLPNLGERMGLIHSEVCKDAFRKFSNEQSMDNKKALFEAKKGCKLCTFKFQIRKS